MMSLKFMPPGVAGEKDSFAIEIPDDEPFQSFVPDIIEAMKLPKSGPDGEIKYAFDSKALGREIEPARSLKEQGVTDNSVVKVRADVVAG